MLENAAPVKRYSGAAINIGFVASVLYAFDIDINTFISAENQHALATLELSKLSAQNLTAIAAALIALFSGFFAALRYPRNAKPEGDFFSADSLLEFPKDHSRYSDRMAYVLAEICELAYYRVETGDDRLVEFIEDSAYKAGVRIKDRALWEKIEALYSQYRARVPNINLYNIQQLKDVLGINGKGFTFVAYLDGSRDTQGFVCISKTTPAFIVFVFRGSEANIEDWLTNADCVPQVIEDRDTVSRVHSGFYQRFAENRPKIEALLNQAREASKTDNPAIFFTGHSLGGALALIATRELHYDGPGACYTFGAPRVADYEYFECVKTPIYRVVNSSDIVPRVPPGIITNLLALLVGALNEVVAGNTRVEATLSWLESKLNKMKYYRHVGDLRYLTDVASGHCDQVKLLKSPNGFDRIIWFWRHVIVSLGLPVKSHGMKIYRRKLREVGLRRYKLTPSGPLRTDTSPESSPASKAATQAGEAVNA